MAPISEMEFVNPDLVANIALYTDRQIIRDPIDIAFEEVRRDPLTNPLRFLGFVNEEMKNITKLKPLIDEDLIDFMPCPYLIPKMLPHYKPNQNWFSKEAIAYIKERTKCRLYPESNLLIFYIGDTNIFTFERYGEIAGVDEDKKLVYTITPPDLENVDDGLIQKWKYIMLEENINNFANQINEKLLIAKLFSGAIATDER